MTVSPAADESPATDRPPLDSTALSADGALLPGLRVEVVEETGSTNALVAERARAGEPEGLVVVAEHQTAGRGRLDRRWETPPRAALTFSVLLRPSVAPASWPWLPLLAGHAVGKTLRAVGHDAAVKWPNDVLIDGRKVAGLLVERVDSPAGPAAVVGIGLNVSTSRQELPVPEATSLALEAGGAPDRTALLVDLLATLGESYAAWQAGGAAAEARLAESYAAACDTVGREVRVDLPAAQTLHGRATGVDSRGRLLVEHDGTTTAVAAGDVVHVRAQERPQD